MTLVNRTLTVESNLEPLAAKDAWLDGAAMRSQTLGRLDRYSVDCYDPALVMIRCADNQLVTIAWPPEIGLDPDPPKGGSIVLSALSMVAVWAVVVGLWLLATQS